MSVNVSSQTKTARFLLTQLRRADGSQVVVVIPGILEQGSQKDTKDSIAITQLYSLSKQHRWQSTRLICRIHSKYLHQGLGRNPQWHMPPTKVPISIYLILLTCSKRAECPLFEIPGVGCKPRTRSIHMDSLTVLTKSPGIPYFCLAIHLNQQNTLVEETVWEKC